MRISAHGRWTGDSLRGLDETTCGWLAKFMCFENRLTLLRFYRAGALNLKRCKKENNLYLIWNVKMCARIERKRQVQTRYCMYFIFIHRSIAVIACASLYLAASIYHVHNNKAKDERKLRQVEMKIRRYIFPRGSPPSTLLTKRVQTANARTLATII